MIPKIHLAQQILQRFGEAIAPLYYSASVYSKWGHLENTNQSHCGTKIEKINKRHISQSALGQKQFEQINECQTVKIGL
jgi:hypothetical protein